MAENKFICNLQEEKGDFIFVSTKPNSKGKTYTYKISIDREKETITDIKPVFAITFDNLKLSKDTPDFVKTYLKRNGIILEENPKYKPETK